MENVVEETDTIGTLKETRCHLWKIVFNEMIWFSLMYEPFWFSTLEFKKAMLIFTGRKILKITISGSFVTSPELSHTISTLDSMTCNIEGHVKLIDRLSSPSYQLIHCISHLSKEQTSAELNVSCFICIQVHCFTTCNLHFCKKGSHTIKAPSKISTQK